MIPSLPQLQAIADNKASNDATSEVVWTAAAAVAAAAAAVTATSAAVAVAAYRASCFSIALYLYSSPASSLLTHMWCSISHQLAWLKTTPSPKYNTACPFVLQYGYRGDRLMQNIRKYSLCIKVCHPLFTWLYCHGPWYSHSAMHDTAGRIPQQVEIGVYTSHLFTGECTTQP